MIVLHPGMTIEDLAKILDENKGRDVEAYIRVESIRGKPNAFLVREPRIPVIPAISILKRQAE